METKEKFYQEVKSEIVEIEGDTVTYMITTSDIDRGGDIMEMRGCDFGNFLKNPVVLWNHNHSIPAVANCLSMEIYDNAILAKTQFHGLTEFSADIRALALAKVLTATSIGFIPKSISRDTVDGKQVSRITEWELLEYSLVNIPMNPYALVQKGLDENIITKDGAFFKEITKAGRTISSSNESKLRQAQELIAEVLATLTTEEPIQEPIEVETMAVPKTLKTDDFDRILYGC